MGKEKLRKEFLAFFSAFDMVFLHWFHHKAILNNLYSANRPAKRLPTRITANITNASPTCRQTSICRKFRNFFPSRLSCYFPIPWMVVVCWIHGRRIFHPKPIRACGTTCLCKLITYLTASCILVVFATIPRGWKFLKLCCKSLLSFFFVSFVHMWSYWFLFWLRTSTIEESGYSKEGKNQAHVVRSA